MAQASAPTAPPSLPGRDRIAILAGLGGVTLLAWLALVRMAQGMDDMASMAMPVAMQMHAWSAADAWMMFVMWAVMMVGMMVPTAVPMTLIYAAVARKAQRQGTPVAPTFVFAAGYVAMWTLFSVGATAAQWALDQAALLSPMMVASSPWLGAALLVAAGVYQLTPAKQACLEHCRAPASFISHHWRPGAWGAFRMGLAHGAFCLGCCWALMGLLFFGGVMNLLWIAAITLFVLAEKILPAGRFTARWSGVALIGAGSWVLARWWIQAA
jgi:predicted metal-binding membrane protein